MEERRGPRILVRGFGKSSGESTPPSPPFTNPSDLPGIQEWWNTGAGISQTSNVMNSWTGQINGTVLTTESGTGMTYSSSDAAVNNQPSITNDGSLASLRNTTITSFTPTTARSLFFVVKPTASPSTVTYMGGQTSFDNPPSVVAFYTSGPGDTNNLGGYFVNGATKTTGVSTANDVLTFVITVTNATTSGYALKYKGGSATSGTFTGVSGLDDQSPLQFEAGGYANGSLFRGKIMECGWVNGVMSATDISNLQDYVDNKY